MRILCVGDVCGSIGCEYFKKVIPEFKKKEGIDFTVVNAENSSDGNGTTPYSAEFLLAYGADVLTGGNHSLRKKEYYDYLDTKPYLLRPHNLKFDYGSGYTCIDMGKTSIAVINLLGTVYLEKSESENPFLIIDDLIEKAKSDGAKIIIVDFHAEATSEKRALALYLDGKVSAFFGTHTHIKTADATVLKNGTGYITDLGMTGPVDSVLGVKSDIIISRFKGENLSERFSLADGECALDGCIFDIDESTGKTVLVTPIHL